MLTHRYAAGESCAVLDGQARHAHLAADQRRVAADHQPVVRGHRPVHLAGPGDLDVTRGLERALDGAGHLEVALDVQLADQSVFRTQDYRVAPAVGAVLGRDLGRDPTAPTPAAPRHP